MPPLWGRMLAKEIVQSRKAVNRLYTAKANLSSVEMQIKGQMAQLRVAGSLQQSAEVMKAMQQLVKLPELQKTMMEMSKEMMKVNSLAGIFGSLLFSWSPCFMNAIVQKMLTRHFMTVSLCPFLGRHIGRDDG